MTNKIEKNGLDLFIVTPQILLGLETIAKMFKAAHDEQNYDFLMLIKTALSKYAELARWINETALLQTMAAVALLKSADFGRQLMPMIPEEKEEKTK